MKRFLGVLVCAFAVNSCSDGNLILQDINFDSITTTQECTTNNIIYKLKDHESLVLEIDKSVFKNEPTPVGLPTEIPISSSIRVMYRSYDGTVSADNMCNTIRPITPNVIDQWIASSGVIQITTTTITNTGPIAGSTRITGYNHHIVFKTITFEKATGPQVYEPFQFGDYITKPTNSLPFAFEKTLQKCSLNTPNLVYNQIGSEAMTLEIDPALLATTALTVPKTGLISSSKNKLTYRLYSGLLSTDYFCNVATPATPVSLEEWNAVSGVSGVSGIVEVTTTSNGTGFKHTIVLKKVTLTNGNLSFSLGDDYSYGELLTN